MKKIARVTGSTARQGILVLARQWKAMLGRPGSSNKADLALTLGISRARVTQVLSVLSASEPVRQALEHGDARGIVITERMWRSLKGLPDRQLLKILRDLTSSSGRRLPGASTSIRKR